MRTQVSVTVLLLSLPALLCPLTLSAGNEAPQDKLMRATVRIRYERTEGGAVITGHGTAFAVDLSHYGYNGRKYLLSAAHNVLDDRGNPHRTLIVEINEGTRTYWSKCKVVAFDEGLDLCLVESGDDVPEVVELGDQDLGPNQAIWLAGSPRGIPIALFKGSVMHRFDRGTVRSAARIPFDHGDSGGPMFCPNARRVVGVAVAGIPKDGDLDHNIGLYVPLVGVTSFLEAHRRGTAPVIARKIVKEARPVAASSTTQRPVLLLEPETKPVAERPVEAPAPTVAIAIPAPQMEVAPAPAAPLKAEVAPLAFVAPAAAPAPAPVQTPARNTAPAVEIRNVAARTPPPAEPAKAETVDVTDAKGPRVHVVVPGENLTKIARAYNVALKDLITANNLRDPNTIWIGAKLQIPSHP